MNLDRAKAAQIVLADDCVKEAFAQIEADIMAEWKASKNPEAREAFWHDMGAIMRLRSKLKSFADDQKVAEARDKKQRNPNGT